VDRNIKARHRVGSRNSGQTAASEGGRHRPERAVPPSTYTIPQRPEHGRRDKREI